ncbi:MAG TPA: rhodanese-like domain-containing protein [Pyrinomonadaceae bacterium]|jgi:rhodanese-related sulfurtransferase/SAM-dependent methyltransferase|nr:rhodanese-like domain-containing protein [Pyrinomonadaceae bacterium]
MKHSSEFEQIVDDAKSRIREVSVADTLTRIVNGAKLIDVREDNEFSSGHAKGAVHIGRGVIERDIVQTFPDKSTELILYCGGGYRSALAADNLQKMGFRNVWSMAGGWKAWNEADAPTESRSHIEKDDPDFDKRVRAREIAAEFAEKGDATGWFDALYKEAAGNNEVIPWADLEPNRYFKAWAEKIGLEGNGRKALVVGCGLGDDAVYLDDLGFEVTAFDISPTAIDWARKLHAERKIRFETADLFQPFRGWLGAFDFVLEVYTIQPLPMEMRPDVIDAIAAFVAPKGELVVVTRGRGDDEEPEDLPWALSRKDLSRFGENGFSETLFETMTDDSEDEPVPRFVVRYHRN